MIGQNRIDLPAAAIRDRDFCVAVEAAAAGPRQIVTENPSLSDAGNLA
jgi:hypothetical protein